MSSEPDADGEETERATSSAVFDRQLLSDLSVNAAPILIVLVFVAMFSVWSPLGGLGGGGGGESGDPLLLFHAALIGGVILVSAVAGWVIRREDRPLEGTAGRRDGGDGGGGE